MMVAGPLTTSGHLMDLVILENEAGDSRCIIYLSPEGSVTCYNLPQHLQAVHPVIVTFQGLDRLQEL